MNARTTTIHPNVLQFLLWSAVALLSAIGAGFLASMQGWSLPHSVLAGASTYGGVIGTRLIYLERRINRAQQDRLQAKVDEVARHVGAAYREWTASDPEDLHRSNTLLRRYQSLRSELHALRSRLESRGRRDHFTRDLHAAS